MTKVAPAGGRTRAGEMDDDDLTRLMLIRHFERALLDLYGTGEIAGTVHTCIGQEYVPVALAPLIDGDFVFSNHRGHGHYLALHDDPEGLLAEILGRAGAICGGVGGSQHLFREDRFLSTGVQGEGPAVAVGMALTLRRIAPGRAAVVFIGDGTFGEGAVYEALNMAQLWRVPLIVVVEHNGIAQSTPTRLQMAGTVQDRAAAFGIRHHRTAITDVRAIRETVAPLIAQARAEPSPLVLEFDTVRLGPHSKGDDSRDERQLDLVRARDWLVQYAASFPDQVARVESAQRERVAALVADVRSRPPSEWTPQ